MSFTVLEMIGVAVAVAAAAIFFHLYTAELKVNGGQATAISQLQNAAKEQANARKSVATIQQRNSSLDYPALVDQLR